MNALTGTWRLFRLNVRLDRLRLPVWIIANIGLVALTLPQLLEAYKTEPARIIYATTSASSPVTRLLNGAITGPSPGNIAVVETFFLGAILFALMNIFLITRHTRQEEETNRTEVILSTLVGRQASLTAALLLAFIVNLVTASLIFMVFRLNGYEATGSLIYSAALGLMGMVFAGVAAITAQLFENTRTANGLAGLVFGVAFMVRGLGDVLGQLQPGGLAVTPNFLSWLSPVGWVLNANAFSGDRWWTLGLFGALTVALIAAAYLLLARRDVGAALFAARPGKAHAAPWLLTRFGLIWRLNRVSTIAWFSGIVAGGATIGAIAHEFGQLIESNEEMQEILAQLGGDTSVTDLLFGFMFMIIAISTAGYALQIITRMRSEESSGRLELLLSTGHSRAKWLSTYVIYSLVTSAIILLATGLAAAGVYGLIDNSLASSIRSLGFVIMVYLPALSILLGAALVAFGKFPRTFVAFAWATLAASLMIFQIGAVLKLPQWVLDLSPFTHTPMAPIIAINWVPLAIQAGVAVGLGLLGFVLFRRRDIATN